MENGIYVNVCKLVNNGDKKWNVVVLVFCNYWIINVKIYLFRNWYYLCYKFKENVDNCIFLIVNIF